MVSIIFMIAGILGGLICMAFLFGVLLVEPTGFFIAFIIVAFIWKWTKPKEKVYYTEPPVKSSLDGDEEDW